MSLVQFLQQSLLKGVTHKTLQQIQQQHTAVETMLDRLASMRALDRKTIIEQKIKNINNYIEVRENIFRVLNGMERDSFEKWVQGMFKDRRVVGELVRIQRGKIEHMIIGSIRRIFVLNRASGEEKEEHKALNEALLRLKTLLSQQKQRGKMNRQQVEQTSRLDGLFLQIKDKFDTKVNQFNNQVQKYIEKIKQYEDTIRHQFCTIFQQEPIYEPQNETPFKQLDDEKSQSHTSFHTRVNEFPLKYDYDYRPETRGFFGYRREHPTRDLSYYDTM